MKEQKSISNVSRPEWLHERIYPHRIIGMGLATLPIFVVLNQLDAPLFSWLYCISGCIIWPHLAYYIAKRSKNPFIAERNNLTFDAFFAGSWAPLLHFNLLPSIMFIALAIADQISSGIRKMWIYGIAFILIGLLSTGFFTGFQVNLESSTSVIVATLPIVLVHFLVVSISSHKLIRRVYIKNQDLKELTLRDPLTALYNSTTWQEQAQLLFEKAAHQQTPLNIMVVDIDKFKRVNDKFGHSAGDTLILELARIIQKHSGSDNMAGRLGGDEFGLIIHGSRSDATQIGYKILNDTYKLSMLQMPSEKFSVSIGIACNSLNFSQYQDWFNSADQALYAAKNAGRNTLMNYEKEPKESISPFL